MTSNNSPTPARVSAPRLDPPEPAMVGCSLRVGERIRRRRRTIGYQLRRLRRLRGLTQEALAGDRPLAAQAISSLAYQTANSDDPRTAVILARSAYEGARHTATATTQALLLERVAWAHACTGELTHTERALDAVDRAFEERRPEEDPPWVYWLDRDEIDVMAGRCYTELRHPAEAVPLLSGVLERYGNSRAREAALYTIWLTESHLQAGEIDRAGATAIRVLEFADRVNSARSDERLAYLRRALGSHRDVASVRAFDERYRSHRGPSD
jgi:transcriptional regulator with XRE-family HTH domain